MRTLEQTFHELTALITDHTRDLANQRDKAHSELARVAAERDKLSELLEHRRVELDKARQSLRAAEADVAEAEAANSDLRTVNKRLVADLAAAMERADNAEMHASASKRARAREVLCFCKLWTEGDVETLHLRPEKKVLEHRISVISEAIQMLDADAILRAKE